MASIVLKRREVSKSRTAKMILIDVCEPRGREHGQCRNKSKTAESDLFQAISGWPLVVCDDDVPRSLGCHGSACRSAVVQRVCVQVDPGAKEVEPDDGRSRGNHIARGGAGGEPKADSRNSYREGTNKAKGNKSDIDTVGLSPSGRGSKDDDHRGKTENDLKYAECQGDTQGRLVVDHAENTVAKSRDRKLYDGAQVKEVVLDRRARRPR